MDLFNDAAKNKALKRAAKSGKDWSQVDVAVDDDDGGDEGGGGPQKGMQGMFKREKLYSLIDKGVFKAETFGNFLIENQEDKYELQKTDLDKGVESADATAQAKEGRESDKSSKDTNESRAADAVSFAETASESSSDVVRTARSAESSRQAISGNKVAGSIVGRTQGNPHGFLQQTSVIAGDVASASQGAEASSSAVLGGKQTGMHFAVSDHHGAVQQSWVSGDVKKNKVGFLGESNKNQAKQQTQQQAQQQAQHQTKAAKSAEATTETKAEVRSNLGRRVGA